MIYREIIRQVVDKYQDRVAVICQKHDGITHNHLNTSANAIVSALCDAGLEKGDNIALCLGNCHHYREMFWAAGKGGFILIPVSGRLKPREMLYIINNCEAKCLVAARQFEDTLLQIKDEFEFLDHFYNVDPLIEGYTYLGDVIEGHPAGEINIDLTEDDLLWFQYTSGTTGLPKGAMLTQGTAGAIIDICYNAIKDKIAFGEGTRALQILPSYSFSGVAFDMMYQWVGALTVIMESFDPGNMMGLIEKHKITDCHIVTVILNILLSSPEF